MTTLHGTAAFLDFASTPLPEAPDYRAYVHGLVARLLQHGPLIDCTAYLPLGHPAALRIALQCAGCTIVDVHDGARLHGGIKCSTITELPLTAYETALDRPSIRTLVVCSADPAYELLAATLHARFAVNVVLDRWSVSDIGTFSLVVDT